MFRPASHPQTRTLDKGRKRGRKRGTCMVAYMQRDDKLRGLWLRSNSALEHRCPKETQYCLAASRYHHGCNWRVPEHVFASCLDESSLDLPDVDRRVYARPDVHEDVGPQHLHVSRQAVYLHLAGSNALLGSGESCHTTKTVSKRSRHSTRAQLKLDTTSIVTRLLHAATRKRGLLRAKNTRTSRSPRAKTPQTTKTSTPTMGPRQGRARQSWSHDLK